VPARVWGGKQSPFVEHAIKSGPNVVSWIVATNDRR
jgi:hypothetical protein